MIVWYCYLLSGYQSLSHATAELSDSAEFSPPGKLSSQPAKRIKSLLHLE